MDSDGKNLVMLKDKNTPVKDKNTPVGEENTPVRAENTPVKLSNKEAVNMILSFCSVPRVYLKLLDILATRKRNPLENTYIYF